MKNISIILASGTGSRFGSSLPKQFVKLAGKSVFEHTIEIFEKSNLIDEIVLVVTPQYEHLAEEILLKNSYKKVSKLLKGGATRKESSSIAVASITETEANLIIHDCARPLLSQKIIKDCVKALESHKAVDVAIETADTIIKVKDDFIESVPQRSTLMRGQTPQCFKLSLIKEAHRLAKDDEDFSDDCGIVLKYNLADVFVVKGDEANIKITHKEDIFMADKLFQIHSANLETEPNLNELKDKVLVVFGGNGGIGLEMASIAKSYGAKVHQFSRANGVDITDFDAVKEALQQIYEKEKRIDYIVNSAGVLKIGKLVDRKHEEIKQEIEVNYLGSINVCKAGSEFLQNGGMFLLFTSSSYTRGRALYSTYSSTKAAVVNLTQALCEEFASSGVRINVINPERTATPMRFNAFGAEPEGSLLSVEKAARVSLGVLLSSMSGEVVDVRR